MTKDFGKSEKQKDDELSRAKTTEEDANGSHSDCNRQVSTKDNDKEEDNDKEQDNDKKEDNDKGIEKCFARQEEMPFYIFLEVNLSIEPPDSKTTSFDMFFIISVFLCFPIRKLCIVVLLGRPGKTKFEVNLSFAAKFRTTVKATSGNVTGLDWIRFEPQQ